MSLTEAPLNIAVVDVQTGQYYGTIYTAAIPRKGEYIKSAERFFLVDTVVHHGGNSIKIGVILETPLTFPPRLY